MNDILVSTHAAIRMCERALGTNNPTPPQIAHAKTLIEEELISKFPKIIEFGSGSYKLREYEIICVLEDGRVLTCKQLHETCSPKLDGGITRSGNKFAKKAQKRSKMKEESDFVRPSSRSKRKNKGRK